MQNETVRAITADRGVRVAAMRADNMVQDVLAIQAPSHSRDVFGQLMMAAALIRETMAPDLRVQVTLRGENSAVFADSYPGGVTRGIVAGRPFDQDKKQLQVARVLKNGTLQQGLIEVHGGDVAAMIQQYMAESEQAQSLVRLEIEESKDRKISAVAVMAQLLPDGTAESMAQVEQHLNAVNLLSAEAEETARALCPGGLILSHHPIEFGCVCNRDKVVGALATMGVEEIQQIVRADETLTINCEYCLSQYNVTPNELAALLPN